MNDKIMPPMEIERRSFEIITQELGGTYLQRGTENIVKRVIHTSADFDYAKTMYFSPDAVEIAKLALRQGAHIVTDTQMARSGINKAALQKLGGEVHCFMSDEDVANMAKERGITRAAVSMEKAAVLDVPLIFAIGNAPTALIRLNEMICAGELEPKLIIGVPVGFVNVVESKELIKRSGVPCIIAEGRKGGSTIAAAIVNALLYELIGR